MNDQILEHYQAKPHERFKVLHKKDPYVAAILLLSFLAYPSRKRLAQRQSCTDALQAWLIRRAYAENHTKPQPHDRLRRANLPPRELWSRVMKASRRIQFDALPTADIAYELFWRKIGGYSLLARALATTFKAESVKITTPKNFLTETAVINSYLRQTKSSAAQLDMRGLLENFRRREWQEYMPAIPMLIALEYSVLGIDPKTGTYARAVPGHPKRALAISLLRNPQIWIPNIVQYTAMWRQLLVPHFKEDAFAEILAEEDPEAEMAAKATGAIYDGLTKLAT